MGISVASDIEDCLSKGIYQLQFLKYNYTGAQHGSFLFFCDDKNWKICFSMKKESYVIGKLKVMPRGSSSPKGTSAEPTSEASLSASVMTSAMQSPIHAKRSSA